LKITFIITDPFIIQIYKSTEDAITEVIFNAYTINLRLIKDITYCPCVDK